MDTECHQNEDHIYRIMEMILNDMEIYRPKVGIVSDDNAVKYQVVPHLMVQEMPVIFLRRQLDGRTLWAAQ